MSPAPLVDLQSCADEPIHIPGFVQPHGFMVFFDTAGVLEGWSANIPAELASLQAGLHFDRLPLPALAAELIEECVSCQVEGE